MLPMLPDITISALRYVTAVHIFLFGLKVSKTRLVLALQLGPTSRAYYSRRPHIDKGPQFTYLNPQSPPILLKSRIDLHISLFSPLSRRMFSFTANTTPIPPIITLHDHDHPPEPMDLDTEPSMNETQAIEGEGASQALTLYTHPNTEASMNETQVIEDSQALTFCASCSKIKASKTQGTQTIEESPQALKTYVDPNTEGSKATGINEVIQVPATPPTSLPRWRAVWKVPDSGKATTPPRRENIDQHPKKARKVTFCDLPPEKASSLGAPKGPLRRKKIKTHQQTNANTPKMPAHYPRDTTVTRAWGKLVAITSGSDAPCHAYNTMYLLAAYTSIGRSRSCTYRFNYVTVSRVHVRIILAEPDDAWPLDNMDPKKWRARPSMRAWINVEACNGCWINGERKIKGYIGRIYEGDILQFFQPEGIFNYTCDFDIGDHERPRASIDDCARTVVLYSPVNRKRKREREE